MNILSHPHDRQRLGLFIVFLLVAALLSACATPLRSSDFETHALATSKALDAFFIENKSKSEKIQYSTVEKKYNEFEADIDGLVLRARLVVGNEETAHSAEVIRKDFLDMREFHKREKELNPAYFGTKQLAYETFFYSLLYAEKSKPSQ